jgi:hypothetical protein
MLCLQDDCIQILDLSKNRYVNIFGHKSFTNHSEVHENFLLVSSFDGSLSVT